MSEYTCEQCHMSIKSPVCAKCNVELVKKIIEKDHKQIQVAKCPKCHGMIKSPQCCGHDMKCSS